MASLENKKGLSDWYRQWRVPLQKFLRGRGALPTSEIDDVAQEVFLRLMRYDRMELIEHPQAYLYKMAANVAAEWSIRSRRRRPHDQKWLENIPALGQPEDKALGADAQKEVQRALSALTPQQREVLKLLFFEGLKRSEIAARLGTTERSVKRLLLKGYERMRQELDADLLRGIGDGHE